MEIKGSADHSRSAAFRGTAIAVESCDVQGGIGADFPAIGRDREEACLLTRAMKVATAVSGPGRARSLMVALLLIFVV